jgi:hypothetical protein
MPFVAGEAMNTYHGEIELQQDLTKLFGGAVMVLFLVSYCSHKQVVIGSVKTDTAQCVRDYDYVTAHKEHLAHVAAFSRGMGSTPRKKPSILIFSKVGICGKAADAALSRSVHAGSVGSEEFDRLYAMLKENAGR